MTMSSLPWGRSMIALSSPTCCRRLGKCRWVEMVSRCLPPRATEFLYSRLSEFSGNGVFHFQSRFETWTLTLWWKLSLHWFHIELWTDLAITASVWQFDSLTVFSGLPGLSINDRYHNRLTFTIHDVDDEFSTLRQVLDGIVISDVPS